MTSRIELKTVASYLLASNTDFRNKMSSIQEAYLKFETDYRSYNGRSIKPPALVLPEQVALSYGLLP
jgi:hypothetical protein